MLPEVQPSTGEGAGRAPGRDLLGQHPPGPGLALLRDNVLVHILVPAGGEASAGFGHSCTA